MRAIDLYAGVGGWALGLKMAGIDVVKSYEWWAPAARTHRENLPGEVEEVDIRSMDLNNLPDEVDIVVGSPPCTQFSYANRGGSGDMADGLKDLYRFFEVVRRLEPRFWAMENVPRVAKVLRHEIQLGGVLEDFKDLIETAAIEVVDMSKFGVPQRRKRCIAGTFSPKLLDEIASRAPIRTLGEVVSALKSCEDPNHLGVATNRLTDNDYEMSLGPEEARFNREMKEAHPVYNGMPFPEPPSRPSRTITATCTRVSRESLIIEDAPGQYRRPSVRERASLQGFPIAYQFHGRSHAEKLKMIGNAIPPLFTYYIATSFKGIAPAKVALTNSLNPNELISPSEAPVTSPDVKTPSYRQDRRFRFAVPGLRFKSGMRFDLTNEAQGSEWLIEFYFGDSKRIERRIFDGADYRALLNLSGINSDLLAPFTELIASQDFNEMQRVWARRSPKSAPHPFDFIDKLGCEAEALRSALRQQDNTEHLEEALLKYLRPEGAKLIGEGKIRKNALEIFSGALLAAAFNLACSRAANRAAA